MYCEVSTPSIITASHLYRKALTRVQLKTMIWRHDEGKHTMNMWHTHILIIFSLKRMISHKWPDHFFLVWSFLMKVSNVLYKIWNFFISERSNLSYFSLGGNFLKDCLITFSLFWHEASQGDDGLPKDGFIEFRSERSEKVKFWYFATFLAIFKNDLITFFFLSWGWYWSTVKRWIWLHFSKCNFQGRVWPISHNYRY